LCYDPFVDKLLASVIADGFYEKRPVLLRFNIVARKMNPVLPPLSIRRYNYVIAL